MPNAINCVPHALQKIIVRLVLKVETPKANAKNVYMDFMKFQKKFWNAENVKHLAICVAKSSKMFVKISVNLISHY